MKKLARIAVIAVVVLALCAAVIGCQKYDWGPVGTTDKEGSVSGNGSLVVVQRDTVYFVNGRDSLDNITEPKNNYFGQASIKGSIYKAPLNADGSIGKPEVVVPKMFYTGNANGGIYVYGEWIYYTSPSTESNSSGSVLTSNQQFFRTKTDGTKTQEIKSIEGNSVDYIFTAEGLFYFDSSANKLMAVYYNDSEIGSEAEIASNVRSVTFVKGGSYEYGKSSVSDVIFYVVSVNEDDSTELYSNTLYACNYKGKSVKLIDKNTYDREGSAAAQRQYALAILGYTVESDGIALYYTKTGYESSGASEYNVSTVAYKFSADMLTPADSINEKATLDASKEVLLAKSALSGITPVSYSYGVLGVSSNIMYRYYNDGNDCVRTPINANEDGDGEEMSGSPTILRVADEAANAGNGNIEGKYVYYTISNILYKLNLNGGFEIKLLDGEKDTVVGDFVKPSVMTLGSGENVKTVLFYQNGLNSNYVYFVNLDAFVLGGELLQGQIVGGYYEVGEYASDSNYAYDEASGNYIVTDPADKDKTVKISTRLPRTMTQADLTTYINDHTVADEED
ncbi:MAG: DUF5050 domain-containing protein [Clostridia bacterium]|nr:DUF5050 domain-containing protein [Clostridia bacterium]